MQLSRNYQFSNETHGYFQIKRQLCAIKDISSQSPQDGTAEHIYRDQTRPFNGKLYKNLYLAYCLCLPCPCFKVSYQINGYQSILAQTRLPCVCGICGECTDIFPCNMLSCFPEYEVVDPNERPFGKIKPSWINCPNCVSTTMTNLNGNDRFEATRQCCTSFALKWNIRDNAGKTVSEIYYSSFCGLCPSTQIAFLANLSLENKLLLLSGIPFLP